MSPDLSRHRTHHLFIEKSAHYLSIVAPIFERIDSGELTTFTSAVSLAECLVHPYRRGQDQVAEAFWQCITGGSHTVFVPIDQAIATQAARLRAQYNITLGDALQLAACLASNCDVFLTNDRDLKKIREVNVLVVEDLA